MKSAHGRESGARRLRQKYSVGPPSYSKYQDRPGSVTWHMYMCMLARPACWRVAGGRLFPSNPA